MQFIGISGMSMWRFVSGGGEDPSDSGGFAYLSLISNDSVRAI